LIFLVLLFPDMCPADVVSSVADVSILSLAHWISSGVLSTDMSSLRGLHFFPLPFADMSS